MTTFWEFSVGCIENERTVSNPLYLTSTFKTFFCVTLAKLLNCEKFNNWRMMPTGAGYNFKVNRSITDYNPRRQCGVL